MARILSSLLAAAMLSSCATARISPRAVLESDPAAVKLVEECRRAHGGESFRRIGDISVSYDGEWGSLVPGLQPVLVDPQFRRQSEERILLPQALTAQRHRGPGGEKSVLRSSDGIRVSYNGRKSTDPEVDRAAALVADAYTMFLLGPHYFPANGALFSLEPGRVEVDGRACDRILAVVRPGFGMAAEDRVVMHVDADTRILRRVRMSLNGLESTQGAEVDITFANHRRIGGILWPTDFVERIRLPFDLHAHQWTLTGLDLNRGLRPSDVSEKGWSPKAAKPAEGLR